MARKIARRLSLGRRGVAAVEFALFLPVLVILFIGCSEMLLLYRTEAKLNALAANVAEMVSVQSAPTVTSNVFKTYNVSAAALTDICTGAVYGLQPLPPTGLTIAIASVTTVTPGSPGQYDIWETDNSSGGCTATGTIIGPTTACSLALHAAGGAPPNGMLPNGSGATKGDNIIIVRATLSYPGIVGILLGSRPTFTQTAFSRWVGALSSTELLCSTCSTNSNVTCS